MTEVTTNNSIPKQALTRLAAMQQLYALVMQESPLSESSFLDCSHAWITIDPDLKLPCNKSFCKKLVTHALDQQVTYLSLIDSLRERYPETILCCLLFVGLAERELRPKTKNAVLVSEYLSLSRAFLDDHDITLFHALLDRCLKKQNQTGKDS